MGALRLSALIVLAARARRWLRPRVIVTVWGAGVDIGYGREVPFDG